MNDQQMNSVVKTAAVNSVLTSVYIALVASFLFYIPKFFDQGKPDTVFAPILMLSLLVFSAAVTGFLVFGRPVMLYLDGKKAEALHLLGYTLGFFFLITLVVFFAAISIG